jgi:hypothetical protein
MNVSVNDPFGAAADKSMPTLAAALDPVEARKEFRRRLPRLSGKDGRLRLQAIRVIRHKPGRRCVVEYDVEVERPNLPPHTLTLIGKIRARRFGKESFRLLMDFWNAGFDDHSPDAVSVPEPIGVIARFQMWFQRKALGAIATSLLAGPRGASLARQIAEAIHKVHRAKVPTDRRHEMADELRILNESLAKTAQIRPEWSRRLRQVFEACERLVSTLPASGYCGIHRDFYPAQVLVDDRRLFLIDFDLYCIGDPALDVGNFIGHMTEQGLRELGDARAMAEQEQALEERFVTLAGEDYRSRIQAYTTLTLTRHVYLSTQFSERQKLTTVLLALSEQRLGL